MGRILGLDFGTVRVGAALSDPTHTLAQALPFIPAGSRKACVEAIAQLCRTRAVERIVLGLPRHLDGREGDSAVLARQFGDALAKHTGLPVVYLDERLTSLAAERLLIAADLSRAKRRERIDSVAAAMLLQDFLDQQANKPDPEAQ